MRYSVVLFFSIGILNAAPLVDFGAVAPESIRLHTPGKREQAAGIDTFDRRKALRIDWNNARAGHFEFHTTDKLILPEFLKAKIRVQAYLPEHCKARSLNLRIVDRDGETFQVYRPLAGLKPGWNEIIYELDSETPGAGSLGRERKRTGKSISGEARWVRCGLQLQRRGRLPGDRNGGNRNRQYPPASAAGA